MSEKWINFFNRERMIKTRISIEGYRILLNALKNSTLTSEEKASFALSMFYNTTSSIVKKGLN